MSIEIPQFLAPPTRQSLLPHLIHEDLTTLATDSMLGLVAVKKFWKDEQQETIQAAAAAGILELPPEDAITLIDEAQDLFQEMAEWDGDDDTESLWKLKPSEFSVDETGNIRALIGSVRNIADIFDNDGVVEVFREHLLWDASFGETMHDLETGESFGDAIFSEEARRGKFPVRQCAEIT